MRKIHKFHKVLALTLAAAMVFATIPAQGIRAEEKKADVSSAESEIIYERIDISTADQFVEFVKSCYVDSWSENKYVSLKADIDLTGTDYRVIPVFNGIFDGVGHTISGFDYVGDGYVVGLFRYVESRGVIQNLTLKGNIEAENERECIGSICGVNYGTIKNCTFQGTVSGRDTVGGIAGINESTGLITGCTSKGRITGYYSTGGVTGINHGILNYCSNRAGINDSSAWVEEDDEMGTGKGILESLTANDDNELYSGVDTGGIAGFSDGMIVRCTNAGTVGYEHTGYNIGGIAGRQAGIVSLSTNNGTVYGRKDIGGIVGQMEPFIEIDEAESLRNAVDKLHYLIEKTIDDVQATKDGVKQDFDTLAVYSDNAVDAADALAEQLGDFADDNLNQMQFLSNRLDRVMEMTPQVFDDFEEAENRFTNAVNALKDVSDDMGKITKISNEPYDTSENKRITLLHTVGGYVYSNTYNPGTGEKVTITAKPEDAQGNYQLSRIDVINVTNGEKAATSTTSPLEFTMPAENVRIEAYFEPGNGISVNMSDDFPLYDLDADTLEPEIETTTEQETESEEEAESSTEQETTNSEKESSTEQKTTGSEPESSTEQETTSSEPESSTEQETTNSGKKPSTEQETTSPEPESSSEPEAASSESESSSEPEAASSESESSSEPEAASSESESSTEPEAASSESKSSTEQTTGSEEKAEETVYSANGRYLYGTAGDKDGSEDDKSTKNDSIIKISSNLSGSVSCLVSEDKDTATITAQPSGGYTVESITLNGSRVSTGGGNSYSFGLEEGKEYKVYITFRKVKTKSDAAENAKTEIEYAIREAQDAAKRISSNAAGGAGTISAAELQKMLSATTTMMESTEILAEIYGEQAAEALKDINEDLRDSADHLKSALEAVKGATRHSRDIVDYVNSQPDLIFTKLDERYDMNRTNLHNQLRGMTDSLKSLSDNASNYSDVVNADLKAVNDQINVVFNLLADRLSGAQKLSLEELYQDVDDEDVDSIIMGRAEACSNKGVVKGDINVGGIAGSMSIDDEDPEDSAAGAIEYELGRRFITKCLVTNSINEGYVTSKKNGAGGICGYMNHGIIVDSESYGGVESTEGDYVGGICGESLTIIKGCYSLCSVAGNKNVGGIAGYADTLKNCYSMADVQAVNGRAGAIAGQIAEYELAGAAAQINYDEEDGKKASEPKVLNNYYVGEDVHGIDNISYIGIAEPIDYEQLLTVEQLPSQFRHLKVIYRIDDTYLGSEEVEYGTKLDNLNYPQIPEKEGCYGVWPDVSDKKMGGIFVVEGEYKDNVTVVQSDDNADPAAEGQWKKPYALVEDIFTEDTILNVRLSNEAPPEYAGGKQYVIYEVSVENGGVSETDTFALRILNPYDSATVYGYADGTWTELESKARGQYLQVDMTGAHESFCVVENKSALVVIIICAASVAAVLIILIVMMKKAKARRKQLKTDK